jgi:thiamine-monophosphate kinase
LADVNTQNEDQNPQKALAEFDLIDSIFTRRVRQRSDVSLGIGDDAAVTTLSPEDELVTATDMLVEGTHFLRNAPARSVGHRSLAVNLSDIAAMGADPLWACLAISIPEVDKLWLEAFADGFFALADDYGVSLIGGDTVSGPLSITVTALGSVPRGKSVNRSGAAVGDFIYVSGEPGAAAAGRLSLDESFGLQVRDAAGEATFRLQEKFLYPLPRLALGRSLRALASSMIDISDGLHADLSHLLQACALGADLDINALSFSADFLQYVSHSRAIELALCGGEDYELLFTIPPRHVAGLQRLSEDCQCPLVCIGKVTQQTRVRWFNSGEVYAVPDSGYQHFGWTKERQSEADRD